MDTAEALRLFRIWFEGPINRMSDDDGFVAMMVALPLFERLVEAKREIRSAQGENVKTEALRRNELGLSSEDDEVFWIGVRGGFMHQGMPAQEVRNANATLRWRFHTSFSALPTVRKIDEHRFEIDIDPLKFARHVVNEFLKEPELIWKSMSHPFASVTQLEDFPKSVTLAPSSNQYSQKPYAPTQATGTMVSWTPAKPSAFD